MILRVIDNVVAGTMIDIRAGTTIDIPRINIAIINRNRIILVESAPETRGRVKVIDMNMTEEEVTVETLIGLIGTIILNGAEEAMIIIDKTILEITIDTAEVEAIIVNQAIPIILPLVVTNEIPTSTTRNSIVQVLPKGTSMRWMNSEPRPTSSKRRRRGII